MKKQIRAKKAKLKMQNPKKTLPSYTPYFDWQFVKTPAAMYLKTIIDKFNRKGLE